MTVVDNPGPISLVGGDEFGPRCESMDRELLDLRPSTRLAARLAVAVVPTAAAGQRPELAAANGTRYFESLGAEARGVMARGEMRSALESLAVVRLRHPHDGSVLRQAEEMRREILADMEQRIAALREDAADASFFRSRDGFLRVRLGIAELIRIYGAEHLPQVEALQQLSSEMENGMQILDSFARAEHVQRLQLLEEAFRSSTQDGLADLVQDYLKRHYSTPQDGGGK